MLEEFSDELKLKVSRGVNSEKIEKIFKLFDAENILSF